jgi:hypothetical protein
LSLAWSTKSLVLRIIGHDVLGAARDTRAWPSTPASGSTLESGPQRSRRRQRRRSPGSPCSGLRQLHRHTCGRNRPARALPVILPGVVVQTWI